MDISHSIRLLGEGSTTFTYTKGAAYNISQETRKPIMNSATIILFFGLVLSLANVGQCDDGAAAGTGAASTGAAGTGAAGTGAAAGTANGAGIHQLGMAIWIQLAATFALYKVAS